MHTAHSYLGLTEETMRAEHVLNQTRSTLLPHSFYQSGALKHLQKCLSGRRTCLNAASRSSSPRVPTDNTSAQLRSQQFTQSAWRTASPEPNLGGSGRGNQAATSTSLNFGNSSDGGPVCKIAVSSLETAAGDSGAVGQDGPVSRGFSCSQSRVSIPQSCLPKGPADAVPDSPDVVTNTADGLRRCDEDQFSLKLKEAVLERIIMIMGVTDEHIVPAAPGGAAAASKETGIPFLSAQELRRSRTPGGAYKSVRDPLIMSADATAVSRHERRPLHGSSGNETPVPFDTPSSATPSIQPLRPVNDVQIMLFPAKCALISAGEHESGLFYVIDGILDVVVASTASQATAPGAASDSTRKAKRRRLYSIGPGGLAGYLATLLTAPSYVDVIARTDCYVGYLPAQALNKLLDRRPTALFGLCQRLLSLLSPTLLQLDASLDWQHVNAGQVIYRQNEAADKMYLVVNGRLRAIQTDESVMHIVNESGMGDSVGELEVLTSSARTHTLYAIRDTELVCIPLTLFKAVSALEPRLSIQLAQIIARRTSAAAQNVSSGSSIARPLDNTGLTSSIRYGTEMWRSNTNLKTVAVVPVTRQVPIAAFARRLHAAFYPTTGKRAVYLNQSVVMGVLGRNAFNRLGQLKLTAWLADQESKYRMVFYVVDTAVSSPWAQTSIRQADCVMLVGFGDDPAVGEYERLLLAMKTAARKELVLLHPERSVPPGSTRAWLRTRPWVTAHHHVEMPGIMRAADDGPLAEGGTHDGSTLASASVSYWRELVRRAGTMTASTIPPLPPLAAMAARVGVGEQAVAVKALKRIRGQIGSRWQRYREKRSDASAAGARPAHLSDYSRLARRLCGQSVGLVLGGGGARGIAHLGVIRALEEGGIPVDLVGGTSIGAFVGGLYAREAGLLSSYGRAKKFAGRMSSVWRFLLDLTYPYASYTTGHEFNRGVFKAFRETHIEDMWLPFFCNTTNVTWSRMEVHTTGYAWRFIRGSMTLTGQVPPLTDDAGNMLVDGGYMDNLPVSTMFSAGAARVFAVDVGSTDDTSPRAYGDTLSGTRLVLARWVLPFVPGT